MYEWHALDHVPLASSYAAAVPASRAEPFDYFHINSIDVESNGDLLVDSRNTWAAYDVDPKTGQVRWQLGGKHSSFKLGPGAAHRLAARCAPAARRRDHVLRQRRLPAGAPAVARDRSRARPARHDGVAGARLRSTTTRSSRAARATSRRCRRRLDGRLGPGRLPLGGRPGRAACCSTPICRRTGSPTAPTCCRGADSRWARRALAAAARDSVGPARPPTRAGTAPPKSPPGGCSAAPRRRRSRPLRARRAQRL